MEGHKVILRSDRQRQYAHRLINQAPEDAVVNVKEGTRTLEQNDLMWVLLTELSAAKPEGRVHPPLVWKTVMMSALGHEVQTVEGLHGEPVHVGYRSSKLSKSQMSDLIELIRAYGAQHGVQFSEREAA